MKKVLSILLAVLLLFSLCANAYAEETEELIFTPDIVMDRLEEGDDDAQTAEEQTINGVYRLAEMLAVAAAVRATEEECESINAYLERIYDDDEQELGNQQKLALGAMQAFNILEILAEQEDPDMNYQSDRDEIREYFNDGDDDAKTAKDQTLNALFSAVSMTALILEEISPTEEMLASIDEELNAFSDDNNVCEDVNDQIVNGAYWLQRMLTNLVTFQAASDDFANAVLEINAGNTQDAINQTDQEKELVVWLYSCVQMSGLLAEELLSEAE